MCVCSQHLAAGHLLLARGAAGGLLHLDGCRQRVSTQQQGQARRGLVSCMDDRACCCRKLGTGCAAGWPTRRAMIEHGTPRAVYMQGTNGRVRRQQALSAPPRPHKLGSCGPLPCTEQVSLTVAWHPTVGSPVQLLGCSGLGEPAALDGVGAVGVHGLAVGGGAHSGEGGDGLQAQAVQTRGRMCDRTVEGRVSVTTAAAAR